MSSVREVLSLTIKIFMFVFLILMSLVMLSAIHAEIQIVSKHMLIYLPHLNYCTGSGRKNCTVGKREAILVCYELYGGVIARKFLPSQSWCSWK